ncbi:MAG: Indole-3-glycerol phosphate synthase [Firmicutes bacterium ADurb.Bin419]|nr:MAG: Indole-3-glycerol phosphate synthase [Firmicutes bacterium ADurb.Bin419]
MRKIFDSGKKCSSALWNKKSTGLIPVITDIKCKSPGEGDLLMGRDPVAIAGELNAAGVPVISVVTEDKHYGGSPELLYNIAKNVSVPILRKDFISTREQLQESVDIGASGVLLIASMLEKTQLFTLIEEAYKLGLEPLVETHSQDEIMSVRDLELTFLGINNRNIVELETDDGNVNTTEKLATMVPSGALLVSESSISSKEDVARAIAAGAHAVLVGTAILKAKYPVEMFINFSKPGR